MTDTTDGGTTVTEGGVTVRVEDARDGASAGTSDAVFYNPEMELNRDVTVAVLRALTGDEEPLTYFDATTASGIRAARALVEGYDVTAADVDPEAVALARENLTRVENSVSSETDGHGESGASRETDGHGENDVSSEPTESTVRHADANVCLHQQQFDVVDVDPYGSPVPFADAAVRSARELVCVTATDTAPLCGAHFDSGRRRYETTPRNTEYHPEMGLRVLLSAMVRTGAKHDIALRPVCSHVSRHYARTYLDVERSATAANDVVAQLGHVSHCQDCLARQSEYGLLADSPARCSACNSRRVVTAGPIWLGAVADTAFTERVRAAVTDDMGEAKQARKLLGTVATELDTPTHYDQHRLCEAWGRPAAAMDEFLDALRAAGFDATRAHYSGTAFKTNADVTEIRAATSSLH